jgi:hypothetical protein
MICPFDTDGAVPHPTRVLSFNRRLPAVVLAFALAAGQAGMCAGWMATPEARMACCADDGPCPMHKSERGDGSTRTLTQAEADRCCAAAEQDERVPSSSGAAFSGALGLVLGPVPALTPDTQAHVELWRASAPIPKARVPRHLLLSVLLV